MSAELRVLLVAATDAAMEPVLRMLTSGGYQVVPKRVSNRRAFGAALVPGSWDLIIADLDEERFDGLDALALLRESGLHLPLIVIGEAVEVERAVAIMRAGATDCILRRELARLVPSVNHELRRARHPAAPSGVPESAAGFAPPVSPPPEPSESEPIAEDRATASSGSDPDSPRGGSLPEMSSWCWELADDRIDWSDAALAMFRETAVDVPSTWAGFMELVPESDRRDAEGVVRHCLTGDQSPFEVTLRIDGADGTTRWVELRGWIERTRDGDAVRVHGTIADITGRKDAEAALREGERRYRELYEDSPVALLSVNAAGAIVRANRRTLDRWGYEPHQLLGRPFLDLFAEGPDGREQAASVLDKLREGQSVANHLVAARDATGAVAPCALSMSPVFGDANGAITGRVAVVDVVPAPPGAPIDQDVVSTPIATLAPTDSEPPASAPATEKEHLEALRTLAGGIAHDFNNLLLAILGYGELTRDDLPEDSPLRGHLEHILSAGERARDLVKQILAFGRQDEMDLELVEMQLLLRETVDALRATLPPSIELRERMDESACVVLGDPEQLRQVVENLGSNAAHAMPEEGGVLEFAVEGVEVGETLARDLGGVAPGPYVRLAVIDSGHGMDRQVMHRVYDPFFTTKAPGVGTGLGLSVVHGIVLSHGGALNIDSSPGRGTRVEVYLPRSAARSKVPPKRVTPVEPGTARILFVDDEEQLASLGRTILEKLGYHVTVCSNSEDALHLFRMRPDDFDLVVTDQTMPRLTGLELARELRMVRSEIPIVLTTGYSEAVTTESLLGQGISALVMKPYSGAELGRAVRDALKRVGAASA